jgi:hypothetical protein
MSKCLFAAFSAYIMVAFVNMELNPGLWGEISRFIMAVVAMFIGSVLHDGDT